MMCVCASVYINIYKHTCIYDISRRSLQTFGGYMRATVCVTLCGERLDRGIGRGDRERALRERENVLDRKLVCVREMQTFCQSGKLRQALESSFINV